jgi:hypothetical protein
MNLNLKEFVEWAVKNSAFSGCDLNGAEVQEKAVACGILVEVAYDPKRHGGNYGCDCATWYVFSDEFRT